MNNCITKHDLKNFRFIGLAEHKCAVCGKEFECRAEYLYKRLDKKSSKLHYFCSYTCFREDEKEWERQRVYNRRTI